MPCILYLVKSKSAIKKIQDTFYIYLCYNSCHMEETAIVKGVSGILATVVVKRTSACAHCSSSKVCNSDEEGADSEDSVIEAINTANAAVGQRVIVELKTYTYLKGAMIVYALPAVALLLGAILGKGVLSGMTMFSSMRPDVVSAIGGFTALVVSLVVVKLISDRLEKKTEYKAVIKKVLDL
ncbi:Positive regulator of sigma(E), RseC/MucC [Candidatus Magnetobacterium bavaricum]|uniref:Positive regulator of sigma(E), RseC/MucC n=1 Tax=Candidatus Magnetobacterium bavaricum TaxID=29290 RepID=A0A0F3GX92_9BACT|nr:Positive regulator of sigma(E), RseC/MucC [Candidatus Magnetobacterium bavaricum]